MEFLDCLHNLHNCTCQAGRLVKFGLSSSNIFSGVFRFEFCLFSCLYFFFCMLVKKIPYTAAAAAAGTADTGTGGDGVLRVEVVRRLADAQRHGEQHVAFRTATLSAQRPRRLPHSDHGGPRGTTGDHGGPRETAGDRGRPRETAGDHGGPRGTTGDHGGP